MSKEAEIPVLDLLGDVLPDPASAERRNVDSASVIRSIISLGQSLKLRTVAEGMETDTQLEFLRGLSCDEYQGFLYSRPLDAPEVFRLLEENLAKHPRVRRVEGGP